MSTPDEVRSHFAGSPFGPPCTEADIRRAEEALGEPLPGPLRACYLAFNGFLGPTDAPFLWPLFAEQPGGAGLVEMNQFFRAGDPFPQGLVAQCIFFGDNGCGPQWGVRRDLPGKVIQWDAEWGDDFEVVGDGLLEVWAAEMDLFDTAEGDQSS